MVIEDIANVRLEIAVGYKRALKASGIIEFCDIYRYVLAFTWPQSN
jgi:hypothetical protein